MAVAIVVLLGLTLQKSLRGTPVPAEREMAEKKLLAALPDTLRSLLAKAEQFVGFEQTPGDIFHPEPAKPEPEVPTMHPAKQTDLLQSQTVSTFFQAVLDVKLVLMHYVSPYQVHDSVVLAAPVGLLLDRDPWC